MNQLITENANTLLNKNVSGVPYSVPEETQYNQDILQISPLWKKFPKRVWRPRNPIPSAGLGPGQEIFFDIPKDEFIDLAGAVIKLTAQATLTGGVSETSPIFTATNSPANPTSGGFYVYFQNPYTKVVNILPNLAFNTSAANIKAGIEAMANWPSGWTVTVTGTFDAGNVTFTFNSSSGDYKLGPSADGLNKHMFTIISHMFVAATPILVQVTTSITTAHVIKSKARIGSILGPQSFWRTVRIRMGDTEYYHNAWNIKQFLYWAMHHHNKVSKKNQDYGDLIAAINHPNTQYFNEFENANHILWDFDESIDWQTSSTVYMPTGLIEFANKIFPGPKFQQNSGNKTLEICFIGDEANKIFYDEGSAATAVTYKITALEILYDAYDPPAEIKAQILSPMTTLHFNWRDFYHDNVSWPTTLASPAKFKLTSRAQNVEEIIVICRKQSTVTSLARLAGRRKLNFTDGHDLVTSHYLESQGVPYPPLKITGRPIALLEFLDVMNNWGWSGASPEALLGFKVTEFTAGQAFFMCINLRKKIHGGQEMCGWNFMDTNQDIFFTIETSGTIAQDNVLEIFTGCDSLLSIDGAGIAKYRR